jgi:Domain of unknown function (DUF5122) beta-propeller
VKTPPHNQRRPVQSPIVTLSAALAALAFASGPAFAAAGDLDPSFDGDGVVSADFGAGAGIESAALQPDGKIVVAGHTASNAIAVARFSDSGSLDATFDPGGPDGDGQRVYTGLQAVFSRRDARAARRQDRDRGSARVSV